MSSERSSTGRMPVVRDRQGCLSSRPLHVAPNGASAQLGGGFLLQHVAPNGASALRLFSTELQDLRLDSLDVRTEFAQLFIEMFVAAIDMIDAAHFGDSVGIHPREHQDG